MTKRPNSDKSGRAQRRPAERAVTKPPAGAQPTAGGIPVSVAYLKGKIGELTIEVDYWKDQAFFLKEELGKLKGTLEPETEETEEEAVAKAEALEE